MHRAVVFAGHGGAGVENQGAAWMNSPHAQGKTLGSPPPRTPGQAMASSSAVPPTTPVHAPPVLPDFVRDESTHETFRVGRLLGKGGFAYAYLFESMSTGIKYAAKVVQKSSLAKKGIQRKLESEIAIHERLKARYIVPFEKKFEDADHVYIILGLCENNSLMEMMRVRKRLTEPEVQVFGLQLLEGLRYLHEEERVIHRDLKLGNLFLTRDMEIRIGDFGLAARIEKEDDRRKTVCGTPNYIAPEVLDSNKNEGHSFQVDIWSYGVVLYTLLVGKPPFETGSVRDTYKKIRSTSFTFPDSPAISDAAKHLIRRLLTHNPEERPTLAAIRDHSFFFGAPRSVPVEALRGPPASMTSCAAAAQSQFRLPPLPTPHRPAGSTVAPTPSKPDAAIDNLEARFTQVRLSKPASLSSASPAPTLAPFALDTLPASDDVNELRSLHSHLFNDMRSPGIDRTRARLLPANRVLRYVDLTAQWGLGYVLTNGVMGARYNDSTIAVWAGLKPQWVTYVDENNTVTVLSSDEDACPSHLRKKVRLVRTFTDALSEECTKHNVLVPTPDPRLLVSNASLADLDLVTRHLKTKNAMMMRLLSGATHLFFYDKTALVCAKGSALFEFRNKDASVEYMTLAEASLAGRREIVSRLHYLTSALANILGLQATTATG